MRGLGLKTNLRMRSWNVPYYVNNVYYVNFFKVAFIANGNWRDIKIVNRNYTVIY